MGTPTSPTMALPGPPTMYQIPPTVHKQKCNNQQHSIFHPNSHPMVRQLII